MLWFLLLHQRITPVGFLEWVKLISPPVPEEQQVLIGQQPYLGSLFKSQNGTTWDPSQYEDMKFTIYKAAFNTAPGVARFYSPQLSAGNKQIIDLSPNPIEILSRKATVGLGTTFSFYLQICSWCHCNSRW